MTKKKSASRDNNNKKFISFGSFKIKKLNFFSVAVIIFVLVGSIYWRNSYLWPWLSQEETNRRLAEVVDACFYNEDSRVCKKLSGRYGMTFEYCHALSDIPEIDKTIPVYGVARLNSFRATSINYVAPVMGEAGYRSLLSPNPNLGSSKYVIKEGQGVSGNGIYPYYGCAATIGEINSDARNVLIRGAPTTKALYELSKKPGFRLTGNSKNCTLNKDLPNSLWSQIPNMSAIIDESNITVRACVVWNYIQSDVDLVNEKINKYATNYQVQLFYQKYDEWNTRPDSGCIVGGEKRFEQRCGDGTKVNDFVSEMRQHLSSDYFIAKALDKSTEAFYGESGFHENY